MEELKAKIEKAFGLFQNNAVLAIKGNKAAAQRSRVASNELTRLFKDWRTQTLEQGNK